tara:strand:+ start:201 stop:701 length:501 start_codon:yes stop_codon:yes gene_type:complete
MKHNCYISIGSNIGDRVINCRNAIKKISVWANITIVSSFYETEPWGYSDDKYYLNAVFKIETSLSPYELLHKLKVIEQEMGRRKKPDNVVYQARIIDLDILFFDDIIINDIDLIIPHPKLYNRKYVLKPFLEINPDFICPFTKKTLVNILHESLDDSQVNIYTLNS